MAEKEYIERDMYYQKINGLSKGGCGDYPLYCLAINDCMNVLDEMPAADVEPVRHGHWYNRGGRFRCSACDNKALLKDIGGTGGWSHEYEQQKSPYCPNCGAKMDGGDLNGS